MHSDIQVKTDEGWCPLNHTIQKCSFGFFLWSFSEKVLSWFEIVWNLRGLQKLISHSCVPRQKLHTKQSGRTDTSERPLAGQQVTFARTQWRQRRQRLFTLVCPGNAELDSEFGVPTQTYKKHTKLRIEPTTYFAGFDSAGMFAAYLIVLIDLPSPLTMNSIFLHLRVDRDDVLLNNWACRFFQWAVCYISFSCHK